MRDLFLSGFGNDSRGATETPEGIPGLPSQTRLKKGRRKKVRAAPFSAVAAILVGRKKYDSAARRLIIFFRADRQDHAFALGAGQGIGGQLTQLEVF